MFILSEVLEGKLKTKRDLQLVGVWTEDSSVVNRQRDPDLNPGLGTKFSLKYILMSFANVYKSLIHTVAVVDATDGAHGS